MTAPSATPVGDAYAEELALRLEAKEHNARARAEGRPVWQCTVCRRDLVRVWSGFARCDCGQLTVSYWYPYNLGNFQAPGSQVQPWRR